MNILNLQDSFSYRYHKVLDQAKTYWHLSITHVADLKTIVKTIPDTILTFIKEGHIYLLISNEYESFYDVPEYVYKHIVYENNIPEHKIILLSGAHDIKEISDVATTKINSLYNKNYNTLNAKFFCSAPYQIVSQYNLDQMYRSSNLKRSLCLRGSVNYKKRFLLLNRRWRLHRPSLVAFLYCKNLLDYGYVSLGSNDQGYTWENTFDNIKQKHITETSFLDFHKGDILNIPNLSLDTDVHDQKTSWLTGSMNQYYENSFMSVVTETNFYDSTSIFFSEKTFKPIIYKQPFIIVGIPKSLELLQSMGFQTFDPFINESYDNEYDDNKRLLMIIDEIERICKMNDEELKSISIKMKDICEHNQKLLLSYRQ